MTGIRANASLQHNVMPCTKAIAHKMLFYRDGTDNAECDVSDG
ncbi:hypothetical protein BVY11_13965 [Pseudomonas amygdali pv. morsprunorum]|uniref:Uncharacterized protein n=6 Tax=Pseudomonas syringae group TaxID=136849 RepID=A0AB37QX42_PSEAV|nr:Uncharacterized protein AC510_2859 [Pseudomonas amygdali pv. myricae]KPB99517.1 Uncharacterized protein AC501_5369 [Pseudomonas amygdali pv. lachrymans]KPW92278.1 Uncharacterized protein ALO50_04426 [Pseudomonas syringae pv. cerasicola]KPX52402.1 hypothetical protein ALO67_100756 [Pseudomonas amygdali pv. hibisci]KPX65063.1 hypothetical protein ALO53_101043 [Pseudomonas amygdali pv. photiniae]KPZ11366.1 hypothetical protein ALO41_100972 [Pseudomonas amygdali pv. ulmi]PPS30140.1 hypothetica